ncbi:hypothetical protein [Zunongwangia sp.]|uniref:hypothetical protein n=1 Tax=Zunongwangia sp. TaxID=1965325 RepID=UPI003AA80063
MNKKLFLGGLVLSFLAISCSDNQDDFDEQEYTQERFNINNSAANLKNEVSLDGAGVLSISSITALKKGKQQVEEEPQVANIALEQIATVASPVINGTTLRASHVDIDGDYAYVTYMVEGNDYLGGIDIINISDRTNPVVESRVTSEIADFTSAFFQNGKLYFSSAVNNDELLTLDSRANLGMVSIDNGKFSEDFEFKSIPGYVAVDIAGFENTIIGVSGDVGVLGLYDLVSLEMQNEIELPDLRSVAYSNGKIAVLTGGNALGIYDASSLAELNTINTPNLTGASKRTIAFKNQNILVSEGENGVGIYNTNSGSEILHLPIQIAPNAEYDEKDIVTNAVSIADDFILMANGGAGFGISRLDENNTLIEEGIVDLEGSSNYVQSDGEYIFVASGLGGLRIIKMSTANRAETEFTSCESYEVYNGKSNVNINPNEEEAYQGIATLKHLNVGGKFTFCGTLNIQKSTNINSEGEINIRGAMAVGTFGKNDDLSINSNAVLRVEGNLTVYGNLNLQSGATLEFVGEDSSLKVYGKIKQNSGSQITGNYIDISN